MDKSEVSVLISIVIPIYNVETYLCRCVSSCLAQTYSNLEIILVDDGSTDSGSYLCDKYAEQDNRIVAIHKQNGGLISARVAGLNAASGDLLMFVDGDDWVEPRYVEACVRAMDLHDADLVCCAARYVYRDGCKDVPVNCAQGIYHRADLEETIFPYLIEDEWGKRFSMSAWGKLFRRDMLERAYEGVDHQITIGEDAVMVRPYVYSCRTMVVLSEPLYDYNRTNTVSMTSAKTPMSWRNAKMVHDRQLSVFGAAGESMLAQVKRNYTHNLFLVAASQFNRNQSYGVIAKQIRRQLGDSYIQCVARDTSYKSWRHRIVTHCVRNKTVLIMFLYWWMGSRKA